MTRRTITRGAALAAALAVLGALPLPSIGPAADGGATGMPVIGVSEAVSQEAASGEPTTVVVRAVSHDAKVIGSGVGGARITIRDASTGDVLARGLQEGGTGSTERIMRQAHPRAATVYGTGDAASFEATISLERPTRVEIVAEGPLGTPHATQRASSTTVLVPGRDVTGEGVILELYGFTVDVDRPGEATVAADQAVGVRASVTMLCGCPIEPGGLWDADRIDVTARLVREDSVVRESEMSYAGETSIFEGSIDPPAAAGTYELEVVAADGERANFGVDRRKLRVGEP